MIGPTPKMSVSVVLDAATARAMRRFELAALGVEAAQVVEQLVGELETRRVDRRVGDDAGEDRGRLRCRRSPCANPPGTSSHSTRVQPADDLGARPGQVAVAARPDLHHRGVVLGRAPRGRRRARSAATATERASFGSFLFDLPGVEQPHPRRELGLHIQHPLAGGRAAAGPADGPARGLPRSPRCAPARPLAHCSSPSTCAAARTHPKLAQLLLARVQRDRGVRSLVRIDPDHHASHVVTSTRRSADKNTAAGMSEFRIVALAPLSSHTAARHDELAPRSQARPPSRQTVREPARRTPRTLRHDRSARSSLNQIRIAHASQSDPCGSCRGHAFRRRIEYAGFASFTLGPPVVKADSVQ